MAANFAQQLQAMFGALKGSLNNKYKPELEQTQPISSQGSPQQSSVSKEIENLTLSFLNIYQTLTEQFYDAVFEEWPEFQQYQDIFDTFCDVRNASKSICGFYLFVVSKDFDAFERKQDSFFADLLPTEFNIDLLSIWIKSSSDTKATVWSYLHPMFRAAESYFKLLPIDVQAAKKEEYEEKKNTVAQVIESLRPLMGFSTCGQNENMEVAGAELFQSLFQASNDPNGSCNFPSMDMLQSFIQGLEMGQSQPGSGHNHIHTPRPSAPTVTIPVVQVLSFPVPGNLASTRPTQISIEEVDAKHDSTKSRVHLSK